MRRPYVLILILLLFCSHDLYLKMESYFLEPNQRASIQLYNGTFEKSENIITRDRMLDASVLAFGQRTPISPNEWQDQDSTITTLPFNTGQSGTYVVGVATKPRNIVLSAPKFNDYLRHDGVLDMLEQRKANNTLDQDAVESYQKHVKAIYQVGDNKTNDWATALNYPIEFVPLENPYEKYSGQTLKVQLLLEGEPLPLQLVYADYLKSVHSHSHDDHHHDDEHTNDSHNHDHNDENVTSHSHTHGQQLRTNEEGVFEVNLPEDGIYYLRTIFMTEVTDSDELTHQSKWATLTFEVSHEHGENTHIHEHQHEDSLPTWMFVLGSIFLVGLLFVIFRKKN